MARKEKKYHYIYKITCIINERYYIGMHSTDNLDDGYFGGGKRIKNSVKKYGKNSHRKEIIEFLDDRKMLGIREKDIVNNELINDPLCLNLCIGGHYYDRGWTNEDRIKGLNKLNELRKDSEWNEGFSKKISEGLNNSNKKGHLTSFSNKKHTEDAKNKIGEKNSITQKGSKNSQFGKIWIYNDKIKENKKINNNDYPLISKEWKKGLKMEYFKNK